MSKVVRLAATAIAIAALAAVATSQSGRQSGSERGKQVLHIVVEGTGAGAANQLKKEDFDLYEGGAPQTLETLSLDQGPARIALLVDNSRTLKIGIDAIKNAARALVNELYEGDQMMIVGYEEEPFILQEFTNDLNALDDTADSKFQKDGFPRMIDAISATLDDALATVGTEKRAIVLITDGYDRDSKTKFDALVARLQREDVIVYVLQVADRTRNASRLEGPKPREAVERLTVGTGGRAFPLDEAATAAKIITEELRLNWYRGVYTPRGVDRLLERNILLLRRDDGPALRAKAAFPGRKTNT
jgi:VWFA-related protein